MMPKFIHDLRERFGRFFSQPRDANFYELGRGSTPLHRSGEESLLEYERYHWGSSPGPWY